MEFVYTISSFTSLPSPATRPAAERRRVNGGFRRYVYSLVHPWSVKRSGFVVHLAVEEPKRAELGQATLGGVGGQAVPTGHPFGRKEELLAAAERNEQHRFGGEIHLLVPAVMEVRQRELEIPIAARAEVRVRLAGAVLAQERDRRGATLAAACDEPQVLESLPAAGDRRSPGRAAEAERACPYPGWLDRLEGVMAGKGEGEEVKVEAAQSCLRTKAERGPGFSSDRLTLLNESLSDGNGGPTGLSGGARRSCPVASPRVDLSWLEL